MHRVLVIGVGSIGERHARCFQSTGRSQISICETNPDVRRAVAERYAIADAFDSFDAAVASRPDVAVICTPAHLHIDMAQRLSEAGAQLLIEKPLSTKLDGIDRLLATLRKRKTVAGVAYVYRAFSATRELRQALQSGEFGAPVELIYVGGQHFPTYRPAYRQIYYTRHETGGGAIQDALTHLVNLSEWLIGPLTRVVADAEHKVLEGVEVEDTVHVVARHGQVMASYALNQHQAPNEGTITIVCTNGTLRYEVHENRCRTKSGPQTNWIDHPQPTAERDTFFVAQANAFLDAVEGKCPVLCTVEEGLHTLRGNLAILEAWRRRAWMDVE